MLLETSRQSPCTKHVCLSVCLCLSVLLSLSLPPWWNNYKVYHFNSCCVHSVILSYPCEFLCYNSSCCETESLDLSGSFLILPSLAANLLECSCSILFIMSVERFVLLSIMSSSLICETCTRILLLLRLESISNRCIEHVLFFYSWINGHLGYLSLLAVITWWTSVDMVWKYFL